MKTIGEAADLARISTETLRHYDRIGLLKPLARSSGGHRLYGREELLRLREILIWRRLGFPLSDIAALSDEPDPDRLMALERQLEFASAQLDKFQGLTSGLKTAIEAVRNGGSVAEDDVFAGFAQSLAHDGDGEDGPYVPFPPRIEERRFARFALMSGHSRYRGEDGFGDALRPRRIVATDPIRLGENLLALGIMPVGAGSFFDRTTGTRFFPWPELVEAPVRERVKVISWHGSNKQSIVDVRPDLILDIRFSDTGQTMVEFGSDGGISYEDLCGIAPVALLEAPIGPPGLVGRIRELAAVLRVEDSVEPLLASWHARILAMREHIAGKMASVLNVPVPPVIDWPIGAAPNQFHEGQIFNVLGLELVSPSEGEFIHWGGAIKVTSENVGELSAPTLFLTVDGQDRSSGPMHRWVSDGPLADLPAVRGGRVFELRWTMMRSGWFTAHRQLDAIAKAYGITRLRTVGSAAPVHLAVAPAGKTVAVSTVECGQATLRGPGIPEVELDLEPGVAGGVDLGDVARDVCAFPQAYLLTSEASGSRRLTVDRESALEHLTQQRVAA